MNKKIMLAIGAMAIAALLGLIFSQTLSVSAGPDLSKEDVRQMVSTQYPGEIMELELHSTGNDPMYQVEIDIEGKLYLLKMDGNSGEVIQLEEKTILAMEEHESEATAEQKNSEIASLNKKEASLNKKEKIELEEKDDNEKKTVEAPTNEEDKGTKEDKSNNKESKAKDEDKATKQKEQKTESANKEPESNKKKSEKRPESGPERSIISTDQAIAIAQGEFSGHVDDVELDTEDGRLIYEIEIESERGEAEIEIDAYTGEVLVVDIDLDD